MKIRINGILYENPAIKDGTLSILQACEEFGFNIPRYCYHQKLSIAGNCRMCLVELEGAPKPVASCAVMQTPTTSVFLDSTVAKKAREGVMEFLLLNHPLDCPICDQAGECDLQDQAMLVGNDVSRYASQKRAVNDKEVGPLVKMVMTRCIHCTRCVRFATEVSGVQDFGVTGRGNTMEIGPYIQKVLLSELSGNIIDLCPVGALTSKPYAFQNRPWELTSVDSVDTTDSIGSSITVQVAPSTGKIARILPKSNDLVNGDWITDKTRFSYDAVNSPQRITEPVLSDNFRLTLLKNAPGSESKNPINFSDIHTVWGAAAFPKLVAFGGVADSISVQNLKKELSTRVKNVFYSFESEFTKPVSADFRTTFSFTSTLLSIDKSDFSFVVGTDVRHEFPLIHAKMLSMARNGSRFSFLGGFTDSSLSRNSHLGTSTSYVNWIRNGVVGICSVLQNSKTPSILFGKPYSSLSQAAISNQLISIAQYVRIFSTKLLGLNVYTQWAGFNYLPAGANEVFFYDAHVVHRHTSLLGTTKPLVMSAPWLSYQAEELPFSSSSNNRLDVGATNSSFFSARSAAVKYIYHGTHAIEESISQDADVLYPTASSFDHANWYVNLEGRFQLSQPSTKARRGRAILEAQATISDTDVISQSPEFDFETSYDWDILTESLLPSARDLSYWGSREMFTPRNFSHYRTDLMTRASVLMSKCEHKKSSSNFFTQLIG